MSTAADNYYARLGVARDATVDEIKVAYHAAARRLHPDVNPDPRATDVFLQIQEAFDVLSIQEKRASYDEKLPEEEETESEITISTRYSRSSLARISEPQLIYVLLEMFAAPGAGDDTSPPINLCLVLDRSTSMQGLRMDTMKSTARELLRQMRPQDYLSIITYSDYAEVLVPATRGSDYHKIESRISMLQTGGSTEIFKGLKAGFFEASRNLAPSFINQLVLITDGRTYGDEKECIQLAEEAAGKGLTISALGIGTEWIDEFLDELTGLTGGVCQFVAKADDLHSFLEEKFVGIGQVFAGGLSFFMEKDSGVEMKYAFRLEPNAGPLSQESPLQLGDLPRETSLSILMEFLVTAVSEDSKAVNLAHGELKMDVPSKTVPVTKIPLSLTRPTSAQIDPEPPPQKIVKALSRLTLYRMQEQARQDVENGDVEQATRRLQNLATHLLSQGERDLARTVLAEADRIQQGQALSEQGEKRIKYGTRALLLPQHLQETG